ncbi:Inositol polyphosphate 5-phosphatase OCRL-1; AltName: Full=Lowe oculocerebrorenal syndrome protein [Serendipita indica DSM 11827]|nr:Inositol polyphosphate 5-phosphatase OCRL-1; AltName: Full=Lowe oculocerebrorenal syndrome protein [Serendipita indica DSM 11827]
MATSPNANEIVTRLLRGSEKATLVIDTRPRTARDGASLQTTQEPGSTYIRKTRRVIAVVSHDSNGALYGGLFIFKWSGDALVLVDTFALSASFEIHVSQVTSSTSPTSTNAPLKSSVAHCLVNILSDGREFAFVCQEDQAVALERECRKLQSLTMTSEMRAESTQSWLAAYSPPIEDQRNLRHLVDDLALSTAFAGSPGDEDGDAILIRDHWIQQQILASRDAFSSPHKLRLRVGTFNVNGRLPDASIKSWVQHMGPSADRRKPGILDSPDMLIFGFQELDLSTSALIYSTSTLLEDTWTSAIMNCLEDTGGSYVKFASCQLVGMLILAFVRKGQRPYISEISTTYLGVGIMGLMGNKGGVGLRFRFRNTVITVVASHLAAHDGMMQKRNEDHREICNRMHFPLRAATPAEAAEPLRPVSSSIFESDVLIWMVNCLLYLDNSDRAYLNYRIELPFEDVMEQIVESVAPRDLVELLQFDELNVSKRHKLAFNSFKEMPITFPPTYRYLLNGTTIDSKRRPAWTDRILSLAHPESSLQQTKYESHPNTLLSDHKPVSADFDLETRSVDPELQRSSIATILSSMSRLPTQANSAPRLSLSSKVVEFGNLRYLETSTQFVEILNKSDRPCAYRIISPIEGGLIAPHWLKISPIYGIIAPHQSITLTLTAFIDTSAATELNVGSGELDTTIVLHVEHGVDYFLAVNGRFLHTCFARSLESLACLPQSARYTAGFSKANETRPSTIPKELMRVIDWLMSHPIEDRSNELFATSSDLELLSLIREANTEDPFPFEDETRWSSVDITLAFAEVLVLFFAALPNGMVPSSAYPIITGAAEEDDSELLEHLSPVSVNVWVTLFAFLQFACLQTSRQEVEAKRIGECRPL